MKSLLCVLYTLEIRQTAASHFIFRASLNKWPQNSNGVAGNFFEITKTCCDDNMDASIIQLNWYDLVYDDD